MQSYSQQKEVIGGIGGCFSKKPVDDQNLLLVAGIFAWLQIFFRGLLYLITTPFETMELDEDSEIIFVQKALVTNNLVIEVVAL
jgi:hypothetical protein